MAIIDKIQLSGTVYTIGNETTTAVTSASTDNEIPTAKAVYDAIPQGGGATYSAGTGIKIDTANTISLDVAVKKANGGDSLLLNQGSNANGSKAIAGGQWCNANGEGAVVFGQMNTANGKWSFTQGNGSGANGKSSIAVGEYCNTSNCAEAAFGYGPINSGNTGSGDINGDSGCTIFIVGNGGYHSGVKKHNALQIMGDGSIYIADTNDTSISNYYEKPMIKLQDTITATAANTTALGGLSLVKLTQAEYDALATKDSNVLYVIVG